MSEVTRKEVESLLRRYQGSRWPIAPFLRRLLRSWLQKDAHIRELKTRFGQAENMREDAATEARDE
jgi:hypothetical protein